MLSNTGHRVCGALFAFLLVYRVASLSWHSLGSCFLCFSVTETHDRAGSETVSGCYLSADAVSVSHLGRDNELSLLFIVLGLQCFSGRQLLLCTYGWWPRGQQPTPCPAASAPPNSLCPFSLPLVIPLPTRGYLGERQVCDVGSLLL